MSSQLSSESHIYAEKDKDLSRHALIWKWEPVAIFLGVVFVLLLLHGGHQMSDFAVYTCDKNDVSYFSAVMVISLPILRSVVEWVGPCIEDLVKDEVSLLVRKCGLGEVIKSLVLMLGFSAVNNLIEEVDPGKGFLSSQVSGKETPYLPSGHEVGDQHALEEIKMGRIRFKISKESVHIDLPRETKNAFVDVCAKR
ncbi:hypothetical protein KI387_000681, partial [Taxus chinensis]